MGGRGGRIFRENGKASKLPIFEDERRIKQPSDYNKRFLKEFGLTEHLSGIARSTLAQHEKQHYLDHKEQLLILDPKGNKVLEKKGEQTKVSFGADQAKGNIVSHNHPAVLPILSPQDVKTFIDTGAIEMRATGLAGQVARIWKDGTSKREYEAFKREYEQIFNMSQNYAAEQHYKRQYLGQVQKEDRYEGMTEHYLDNYPDYIKDQMEYLEKHMDFKKYGINYARLKED